MARRRSSGCGCPAGARKISTKGRGGKFVCQSLRTKKFVKRAGCR